MNINEFIDFILEIDIHTFYIYIICNVKGKTSFESEGYNNQVESEFLSEKEFEEILMACQNAELCTYTYFYVENFLENIQKIPKNSIILETSQRGTGRGRDSLIPAICDIRNLIYCGCNAYVNAICSNKYHWTKILESNNIPVPESYKYLENKTWLNNEHPSNKTSIIKPVYECASIGIGNDAVNSSLSIIEKLCNKKVFELHQPLIVQEFIEGYEVEIPIIAIKNKKYIFPIVGIEKRNEKLLGKEYLSYNLVYNDDYEFYEFSKLHPDLSKNIERVCFKIIDLLDLEGYLRIDCRINLAGDFYFFDINPYPHIVKHSSFAFSFQSMGYTSEELILFIIKLGFYRFNSRTMFEDR